MATADGKFDQILLKVLNAKNNQVLQFLEEVFSFLYRRTDFYGANEIQDDANDHSDLAEKIIKIAYLKYKPVAKDDAKIQTFNSGLISENLQKSENEEEQVDHSYAQWKAGDTVEITSANDMNNSPLIIGGNQEDQVIVHEITGTDVTNEPGELGNVVTIEKDGSQECDNAIAETANVIQDIEQHSNTIYLEHSISADEITTATEPEIQNCSMSQVQNYTIMHSLEVVLAFLKDFQAETNTHFVQQKKDTGFNRSYWNKNSRIQWQSLCEKSVPIHYDGVPFVFLGEFVLACHRGRAKASQRSRRQKLSEGASSKVRLSKKVDCPARIYVKKIVKFPEYKIKRNTEYYKDCSSRCLRSDLQKNKMLKVQMQFYVRTPDISEHQNHVVGDMDFEEEKEKRNIGKPLRKSVDNTTLSTEHIPITQEALEQLMFQHSTNGNQQVAVVIDSLGQQLQFIDTGEEPPAVFFQTLNTESMEIVQ